MEEESIGDSCDVLKPRHIVITILSSEENARSPDVNTRDKKNKVCSLEPTYTYFIVN